MLFGSCCHCSNMAVVRLSEGHVTLKFCESCSELWAPKYGFRVDPRSEDFVRPPEEVVNNE